MTNAEKLAEAREFTESPNLGKSMARELDNALIYIRELADELEVAMIPHAECEASGERAGAQLADLKAALEAAEARVAALEQGLSEADLAENAYLNMRDRAEASEARAKELEAGIEWQYSYFEKWADGSGVYERVTFRTLAEARKWFDNSGDMSGWNAEVKKKDRLVAGIEKRRVVEPGTWVPVESEGTDD